MYQIARRLSSLKQLARPLALTFVGIVLLSLGVAYLVIHAYRTVPLPDVFSYLTLQFLPRPLRGFLLLALGLGTLGLGIWQLSGVVVIPLRDQQAASELVLAYHRADGPRRIAVLSGGAGMLRLASLGEQVERLTCITPVQDPVEYYYRASGLFNFQNVYYVVPTPIPAQVYAELDDGTQLNVMHADLDPALARRHVVRLMLLPENQLANGVDRAGRGHALVATPGSQPLTANLPVTRLALETINEADAIILGPGSLFESILPNLLIDELREAIQKSKAPKIYICNLMTEPGLTTGFNVGDHIRQIKHYGGFTPDYVLVNAQRIDPATQQLYTAANQAPVFLEPEEYEETVVMSGERASGRHVTIEGSIVIETDLASSVIQMTASLNNPGESRAVRVLRHDEQRLAAAIVELLKRSS